MEELHIFSLSPVAKPPAAPPPQEPPVERAKVIFQYKSEQEDELNINVCGLYVAVVLSVSCLFLDLC